MMRCVLLVDLYKLNMRDSPRQVERDVGWQGRAWKSQIEPNILRKGNAFWQQSIKCELRNAIADDATELM